MRRVFWSEKMSHALLISCLALVFTLGGCDSVDGLFANGQARSDTAITASDTIYEALEIDSRSGTHQFRVEVVADEESRRRGLMYRKEMEADVGMLFDFKEERHISMWMKNTYIPLDMLFIDKTGQVVRIAENTVPESLESIRSGLPVLAVLELNAGSAKRWGLRAGDKVRHPLFEDVRP